MKLCHFYLPYADYWKDIDESLAWFMGKFVIGCIISICQGFFVHFSGYLRQAKIRFFELNNFQMS